MPLQIGVVSGALLVGCGGHDGEGGCAAPGVDSVKPASAGAGEQLTITGRYFLSSCGDTTANGVSSTSSRYDGVLVITLNQGGSTYVLADTRVDDDGSFSIKATVPQEVTPGVAEVKADVVNSYGAKLTIVG